eukprot:TCONS_00061749-protein
MGSSWKSVVNIRQLERVQRKSVRWICNQWSYEGSPTAMIDNLKLQTLDKRRQINWLSTLYQFHLGLKVHAKLNHQPTQRCTSLRFQPIQGAILRYTYSFYPYTINEWNKLPANIMNSSSLDIFYTNYFISSSQ